MEYLAAPRNPGSTYDETGLEYVVVTGEPGADRHERRAREAAACRGNAPPIAEQMA